MPEAGASVNRRRLRRIGRTRSVAAGSGGIAMRVWLGVVLAGLALPAAAQDMIRFRAPSGNIFCMIANQPGGWVGARCDIMDVTVQSFARRPADCPLDWGHAFEVGIAGAGAPVCAGDTVADPDAPVLAYGRSVRLGGLSCSSASTGMTCTNREGHGFTLARRAQQVF